LLSKCLRARSAKVPFASSMFDFIGICFKIISRRCGQTPVHINNVNIKP
jgi:hypothetical protein